MTNLIWRTIFLKIYTNYLKIITREFFRSLIYKYEIEFQKIQNNKSKLADKKLKSNQISHQTMVDA